MPVPIPVPLRTNANMRLEAKYNVITEFPSFDLHSAAATGNMGLVEYALARGQPINSVLDGVLPLHAACAGGNEQVVKLLIEHGADVNAPRLPRRYSNEKNRDASAPIVGTSGSTPLHFAAANGNTNIVTTLLLKGAHPDRSDKHGVTAEMLARQNGWLECAEVLKTWMQNKDKDLLEREVHGVAESSRSGRDRQGSFGTDIDALISSRRRINVKRSMDTALSMLKVSSSGLSDTYHRQTPDSSSMPPSPIQPGEYSHSFDGGRRYSPSHSPSPSPIEPGSRRPSLPYIYQSHPTGSSRRHKSPTPSKGPPSPRRPRSAGTGAENSDANLPRSGKRLGTKYSLMNIFKKNQAGESTSSFERIPSQPASIASISNLAIASVSITSTPRSILPSSSPSGGDMPTSGSPFSVNERRFRMGSDASLTRPSITHTHQRGSPSLSPQLPAPSAIDLHNALAHHQQNMTRDRAGSASSANRSEPPGLGLTFETSSGEVSGSPASRGILRTRASSQLGHSRQRSGSANRSGTVFDDVVVIPGSEDRPPSTQGKTTRPSILRAHNRSPSSGQSSGLPSSLRALRFDSSSSNGREGSPSLRGSNSTNSLVRFVDRVGDVPIRPGSSASSHDKTKESLPDSAPPTMTDFPNFSPRSDHQVDDDEQDYGRTYDHPSLKSEIQTRERDGSTASISSTEFPFSINRPPPDPLEEVAKRSSEDSRDRGDSVSSTSTNPNLSTSGTTSGSGDSATATPPLDPSYLETGSEGELKVFVDEPRDEFDRSLGDSDSPGLDMLECGACSPLEIDLSSISSHAQAEALVQRAQRDILEMVQEEDHDTTSKMPLSARLAAYGESLALERRLREQKEGDDPLSSLNPTSVKSRSFVNRQRSMEGSLASTPVRSRFRRPHTSDGTSSNESIPTSTHSLEGSRAKHHTSRSASTVEAFASNASPARLPAGSMYKQPIPLANIVPRNQEQLSRVSSFDGADTDIELGPALFRVSTAPHPLLPSSVPKAKREQARHLASANKLTRMGFSRSDTVAKSPPSSKRFGGLKKSLMQTFKGKQ
ncbi:uncharacterized protein BT62DRAFT_991743 [Guyanagaster necrorhizus]|uniref:Ankyrin n=1 Tax=Guyanagaster necrorhizus TaxID=856835 RepID=A0A9P7VZ07_9AGAR|nr:uncharacterized protein BT62DRAFT_991743 [Guyanagaster necrorhizus MCA 3950]KAG7449559.1 hypothetical protein BT62DRAFT_991743 [Guyanagaster necrorhizus MCA 3950]